MLKLCTPNDELTAFTSQHQKKKQVMASLALVYPTQLKHELLSAAEASEGAVVFWLRLRL